MTADGLDDGVRFRQVLAVRAFAFHEVGNGIEPEPVDAQFQPEVQHVQHLFDDGWVVVIQIGLVLEEAVPIVRLGDGIPCPVRAFGVDEYRPGGLIPLIGLAPDVIVPLRRVGRS